MEIRKKIYLFIALTLLGGSFIPIMLGLALQTNVYELFFFAFLLSIPFSLALLIKNKKTDKLISLAKDKRTLLIMSIVAILFFVPNDFAIGYAEHYISAALTSIIFRTNPLLMLIFVPFLLRERLSTKQIAALSLGVLGLIIGLTAGNPLSLFSGNQDVQIVAFMALMALSYAFATVMIRKELYETEVFIFVSSVVLTLLLGALMLLNNIPIAPISQVGITAIFFMAYINVAGVYFFMSVIKSAKLTFATNFYLLSPFITFIFAYVLLGEAIEPYYLAIAVLVTTGLILQKTDGVGGAYIPRKKTSGVQRLVMFDVSGAFVDSGSVAITKTLTNGGRVHAIKMPTSGSTEWGKFIKGSGHKQIYYDNDKSVMNEMPLVKDIVGAGPTDPVIIKVGSTDDNEAFFDDLDRELRDSS
jgi:drug/metabolite transporter (DMT)-like permease